MEAYIKYKRITGDYTNDELQILFDNIIMEGFEIIYYSDREVTLTDKLHVVMVLGKRQNRVL